MNDTEFFIEKLSKGYEVESFHIKGNEIVFKLKSENDEVDTNSNNTDGISDYIKKLGNYQTEIDGIKYDIHFDIEGVDSDEFINKDYSYPNKGGSYYDSLYELMNSWGDLLGINSPKSQHESSIKIDNNIIQLFEKYPNVVDDNTKVEVYNNLLESNSKSENFETCIIIRNLINKIKKGES